MSATAGCLEQMSNRGVGRMAKNLLSAALAATMALAAAPSLGQDYAGGSYTVQGRQLGTSVSLGGSVVPYKEVTLSAQLPGRIEYLAGEEGDGFEEETLLAKIDDAELLAQRRAAVAEYMNAQTSMRNAGVQYTREFWNPDSMNKAPGGMGLPSLFDQFITEPMSSMAGTTRPGLDRHADLMNRGAAVDQARNAMLRASSQVQAIDAKLRDARTIAPFGGVIVQKFAEVGDTIQPGQPIYKFADIQYLQIKVDVPARLMPGLQKGDILSAHLDVRNTAVQVRVAQIFPMADPQRHTVTVKFDLPINSSAQPGMYATVSIPDVNAPSRSLSVIPKASLIWRGSFPAVNVITEEGAKELRLVRIGDEVGRDYVSVLSGLQEGERIQVGPSAQESDWGASPSGGRGATPSTSMPR